MKKFPFKQESLLQTTFKKKIYFLLSALSSPFGINTLCRKPMSLLSSYLIPGNFQINSHAERTSTGSFGLSHSCSVWSVIAKYDISVFLQNHIVLFKWLKRFQKQSMLLLRDLFNSDKKFFAFKKKIYSLIRVSWLLVVYSDSTVALFLSNLF